MNKIWIEVKQTACRSGWKASLVICVIALFLLCFVRLPISQNPQVFKPFWKLVMR